MVLLIKDKIYMENPEPNHRYVKMDLIWEIQHFLHFIQVHTQKNGCIMMRKNLIVIMQKLSLKALWVEHILAQALITINQWIIQHWDSRLTQIINRLLNQVHFLDQDTQTKTSSFWLRLCRNSKNWKFDKNILKIRLWDINKMIS